MSKFQNLSIDYRQILQRASVSQRVNIAKSSLAYDILNQIPPSEIAKLFPKYYRDKLPAVRNAYYGDFTSGASTSLPDNSYQETSISRPPTTAPDPATTTTPSRENRNRPAWLENFLNNNTTTTTTTTPRLYDNKSPLSIQRQGQIKNLSQQDRMKIMAIAIAEEGNKPLARKRLMETMFNRASAYGMPVNSRNIQEKYYSPLMPKRDPDGYRRFNQAMKKLQNDPSYFRTLSTEFDEVASGSNHSNYATQNSSLGVAKRARAGQTIAVDDGQSDLMSRKDKKGTKYYDRREDKWYQSTIAQEQEYAKKSPTAIIPQDATQSGKIDIDVIKKNPDKIIKDAFENKIPANSKVVENAMKMKGLSTRKDRQQLENYLKHGGKTATTKDNWCAYFVNSSLEQAGIKGSNSGAAGSFHKWGRAISRPEDIQSGNILVNHRISKNSGLRGSHVVIATGPAYKKNGKWYVPTIGGNQTAKDGSRGVTTKDVPLTEWTARAPGENDFYNAPELATIVDSQTAVPALPDNIPDNIKQEVAKLPAEDQEAFRQKLNELGPDGVNILNQAIQDSPSPNATSAAIEAIQSATPAQVPSVLQNLPELSVYEGPNQMPTHAERRKMKEEGKFAVNLDTNYSKSGKPLAPFVVLPNDASPELQKQAAELSKRMVEDQKQRFGRDLKMGGKDGQGWIFQKDNLGPDGKPRGRPNTVHIEQYALQDKSAREFYSQGDGAKLYAEMIADTIGRVPGAVFAYPHGNKNTGKATDKGTDIDMPGYVGVFGDKNKFTEVDAAHQPLEHLKYIQSQQKLNASVTNTVSPTAVTNTVSPTAVIPQVNPSGTIFPDVLKSASSTAVPTPEKSKSESKSESITPTPKADIEPKKSAPDVPMMKSGGEVQASGEDFSIVDNNSKRKLGEVSRGENIRFNTKGRVEVTPDRRIDPRELENAHESRQEQHEIRSHQNKSELPQSTMMQGAKVPEKPLNNFSAHEQWGHTETPTSYVRAMSQTKGRKHDGSFPGSRFGEEQLSAI